MDLQLTPAVVRMLQAFLEDPEEPHYGAELMKKAHVSSGSLYPALRRFEKAGWVTRQEEDIDPSEAGRPARRYYTLTAEGAREAHLALAEFSHRVRPPTASPGWNAGPVAEGL
ncbi:PadR family transcriptional regulator [Streptomyces sp. 2231.1]|uniref:PadR family transcriptional regulator n=1 Tax=Streptomyces sp. 2231.1 TaxID=1855347 RepID=UPI000B850E7D|nr:PadR family transcriptional regulator [Streptomyces sp. 2231.1]